MATQLNDWLSINKASGTGNAEITLTASSYEELVERTSTLKVQGLGTNAILTVKQEAFVPTITITPSVITTDCLGSSVVISITTNISLKLVNNSDWITLSTTYIPKGDNNNITITIDKNIGDLREAVIDVVTFVKGVKVSEINITQKEINYDDMGYAELIYETDTDGETIGLFGNVYTGNSAPDYLRIFKSFTEGTIKWGGVTDIIIDGVRQEWTYDEFFMGNKGEHTVRVAFRNNIIEVNPAAGATGIVGKGLDVVRQYPFENNPNLKRARIPSSLSCEAGLTKLFANCGRLESINIDNNSCMVEGLAYNSSKLYTAALGDNISSIPSNAFYGCTSLSLQITPNITSIDSYAFKGCTVSGDVLDLSDVQVGKNAFNGSNYLYNETIVGYYSNSEAFQGCGGTLRLDKEASIKPIALNGSHFTKIILTKLPWFEGWDSNAPYLKEVEFLAFGNESAFDLLPNFTNTTIEKIIVHSLVPYKTETDSTFSAIAQNGGVLCYPQVADYSSWLSDLTTWTAQTFEFNIVTNNDYFWLEYDNSKSVLAFNMKWSFDQVNWYEGSVTVPPNIRLYCKSETSDGHFNNGYYKVGGDLSSLGDLTERSYEDFFKNSDIVDASELILPWTTLTDSCFQYMFGNCSQLTKAPILPASTLAPYCYAQMFYSCEKLNYIKMLATDVSAKNCLYGWVSEVSSTGTFVKHPNAVLPTGEDGIPNGWTVETATE